MLIQVKHLALLMLLLISSNTFAGGVYMEPDDFINQTFGKNPPKADVLWINKTLKQQIAEILDHKYKGLRIRYWLQVDNNTHRSAWILDEIGKEKPITTGIVVRDGKIEQVKVLIFRESRGWEVRHDFFTDQFKQAELEKSDSDNNHQLNTHIDNISGATLSVRAVTKLARIALLLDRTLAQKEKSQGNGKP